jgi:hypothetical protein
VTHIRVTGGSEESIIFVKFRKCCFFHYLCGPICPTSPPSPHKALEMVLPDVLRFRFVHRYVRTILKTYSESSFLDGSNDSNFSALGLFWAEQLPFEDAETICEGHLSTRNRQKTLGSFFLTLNGNCLVQNRPRELKLMSLELPRNNDYKEYIFKTFLACL